METPSGVALLAQIDGLVVPPGQLALWALGQSGFVIKGGATIAYVDPYLSDSIAAAGGPQRSFPPPLDPAAIRHAQVVFATHAHADHLDVDTLKPLLGASPSAVLVTTAEGAPLVRAAGIAPDRIAIPRLGDRAEIAGLTYQSVPAAHYKIETDGEGRPRWQGFLITCNGVTLYHAGDTIVSSEMIAALEGKPIDLALLPFNGRDYFREEQTIVGNMWPTEAVMLAQRLGVRVLIGIHNDMFAENRVNSGALFDEIDRRAPRQRCHVLQAGELYLYAG
jgi:L-ascorbate 6-phosphate lactonase